MLNRFARALFTRILTPVAGFLVRRGVSPDLVTLIGTLGVVVGAVAFYPQGEFFWGTVFITAFVFSDLIDGTMARMTERSSRWGAWLDSTLDRVGDAAVFGGLVLWFGNGGDDPVLAAVALWCLVMGAVTSYARARAESLGMQAKGGIAERADRLVAVLVMTGLSDIFDQEWMLTLTLWVLAVASTITVLQRAVNVRRQALATDPPAVRP